MKDIQDLTALLEFVSCAVVLLSLGGCVPLEQSTSSTASSNTQQKKLLFEDFRYEENIKTDLLYPNRGFRQDVIEPAVIPLSGETQLILEFDELQADYQDYSVKLFHCNVDWTKSTVPDMEFTEDFNEFPIRTFDYSRNTLTPYTHYTFEVPKVKLPGNYLLMVFRGRNYDDIVLTRRFIVFDQRVRIKPDLNVMTGAVGSFQNHQIEFEIEYNGLRLTNPYNDISVVVRQNQRWDNSIKELKPTQVKEDKALLQYRHFTRENTFVSMNEFRFIDLRSTTFRGQNVASIDKSADFIKVTAGIDKSRQNLVYSQYNDINGQFVVENNDPGAQYLEEDYINVSFWLDHPNIQPSIYILGGFNNWRKNPSSVMHFNSDRQMYSTTMTLKQGFYNYLYFVSEGEPNPYLLEGAFFEAKNEYDITVYYRPPGTFADLAIGYANFNSRK
ncbi:MAG: DUF5103 domain-containing protein [Cyclobacteriaceae bacterium]